MKNGDLVRGKTRPRREGDRYSALMYVESINGEPPERSAQRVPFDRLTPVHPDRRLTLEPPQGGGDTWPSARSTSSRPSAWASAR